MKQAISLEKVAAALKQEELGVPVEDIIQEMGVSLETYLDWRRGHVATTDLEKISDADADTDAGADSNEERPRAPDDEK
ncbi:MAG TPA: hypothetical protein VGM52_09230 [Herbaspirillum sp.]